MLVGRGASCYCECAYNASVGVGVFTLRPLSAGEHLAVDGAVSVVREHFSLRAAEERLLCAFHHGERSVVEDDETFWLCEGEVRATVVKAEGASWCLFICHYFSQGVGTFIQGHSLWILELQIKSFSSPVVEHVKDQYRWIINNYWDTKRNVFSSV